MKAETLIKALKKDSCLEPTSRVDLECKISYVSTFIRFLGYAELSEQIDDIVSEIGNIDTDELIKLGCNDLWN